MAGLVRVLVWLGLLLALAQSKKKGRRPNQQPVCLEQCQDEPEPTCMVIGCKRESMILVDLNVTSGSNEDDLGTGRYCDFTDGQRFCHGSSPDLMTNVSSRCYWQQNCTLRLPAQKLITNTRPVNGPVKIDSPEVCYDKKAEFLLVQHARCFKKKGVFDICDSRKVPKKRGLIRSHADYPYMLETNQTCSKKVKIKKGKELLVTLKLRDMCDTLQIRTKNGTYSIGDPPASTNDTPLRFSFKDHGFVKFVLDGKNQSLACSGFVICYKVAGKKDKKGDICKKITKNATIDPYGPKTDSCLNDKLQKKHRKCCCPGTNETACKDVWKKTNKYLPMYGDHYRGCG